MGLGRIKDFTKLITIDIPKSTTINKSENYRRGIHLENQFCFLVKKELLLLFLFLKNSS